MTKVGEGRGVPEESSIQKYQQQFNQNAEKFQDALQVYNDADPEEKAHLRGVMEQSLGLIRSAVEEIKKPGMAKQEAKVEKEYQAYVTDESPENLNALQQDFITLQDYNKL